MNPQTQPLLYQTIYVSSSSDLIDEAGLERMLRTIRTKNAQIGAKGILLYADGNIIQVLEGEKALIQDLMSKITTDPRHKGVIVLLNEAIEERQFPDWSMGYKKLSGSEAAGFSGFLNSTAANEEIQLMAGRARSLLVRFRSSVG